jgi:hypothetical protein
VDVDARGFSVALVAAEVREPGSLDVIGVLERCGWGAMLLPPEWYPEETARALLDQIAEHVHEFTRHDYKLALIGGRAGLPEALQRVGLELPAAIDPATEPDLEAFLASL